MNDTNVLKPIFNCRVMPAMESEKTVLGALLLEPALFTEIESKLCPADFRYSTHQKIFDTMWKIHRKRNTFDVAMICNELRGETDYIYQLANDCCSTANVKAHADILREKSVQMQLVEVAHDMMGLASKKQSDAANYLIELGHEMKEVECDFDYISDVFVSISRLLVDLINTLDSLRPIVNDQE